MSNWSAQDGPRILAARQAWLASPQGQYVLEAETRWFAQAQETLFGWTALQLGLSDINLLSTSRMRDRYLVEPSDRANLQATPAHLPFASASVDLLLLPHTLDFSPDPHQVLREAERVLIPEGHLLLSGFNPYSLWGAWRALQGRQGEPWRSNFIGLPRLKDWLSLLNLEPTTSAMALYRPPVCSEKWLDKYHFMEAAGNRWWPAAAAVYFVHVTKHRRGLRMVGLMDARKAALASSPVIAVPDTPTHLSSDNRYD